MKVKELIERLKKEDQDMQVVVESSSMGITNYYTAEELIEDVYLVDLENGERKYLEGLRIC